MQDYAICASAHILLDISYTFIQSLHSACYIAPHLREYYTHSQCDIFVGFCIALLCASLVAAHTTVVA